MINSTDKTTEIPLNLIVNTNNKTGYTVTLNSETDETALVNTGSTSGAKINSVDTSLSLNNLPNNTWGVKIGSNTSFSPIPKLTSPMNIIQTAGKTSGSETNNLEIGMKLGDNLESGNYNNRLIFSILTNNYEHIALMIEGSDFNTKLKSLETSTNKIEHFRKSSVVPAVSMNAVNIEDENSDYEIKLWLDPADKTAYYYTEANKVYLNVNSKMMFYYMSGLISLDLSNFDTSQVKNMSLMFAGVSNLSSLDLSSFDTSNVTSMSDMFTGMSNITSLNLSNFNTSKVIDMNTMFFYMINLTSLNLSNFDTSNVTNMAYMFSDTPNLSSLDLSSFNTSQLTNMGVMFSLSDEFIHNDKLEKIYVNNDFNTSKLINFANMFKNRKKLRGGNGSYLSDPSTADESWLRIDDPINGRPGYFTRKP